MHFFFKLIPPRPSFPADMTEGERALMLQHRTYMQEHFEQGTVLCYGPVMSSEGSYGFAVLEMPDKDAVESFAKNDPSIFGGLNRYEVSPMHLGGAQASRIFH
jgi:uncharacterized protein YciI